MNATRAAAVAALAAGLAGTACATGRTPTTVVTIAPAAVPAPTSPAALAAPSESSRIAAGEPTPEALFRFTDDDPTGTPVQFTIRYLNALRAGRWDDAVKEMASFERGYVRIKDIAAAVGRDVLTHAAGGHGALPLCTSGVMVGDDAVVIRCGAVRVMVHVETWRGFHGVKVDEVFVAGDHFGHPHTHAYTSLLS